MARVCCTNSGCREREAHINWSVLSPKKAAPVAGTTLRTTGPVPVDFLCFHKGPFDMSNDCSLVLVLSILIVVPGGMDNVSVFR